MFSHALDAVDALKVPWSLTCVVLSEHERDHGIGGIVQSVHPGARLVAIDEITSGSAETCAAAIAGLDPNGPLLIVDCDITFASAAFADLMRRSMTTAGPDVVLLSFTSSEPRFSYAEIDGEGRVVRTAEKQAISSHALGGAYFFRKASDFSAGLAELRRTPLNPSAPEYYVSLVVNALLTLGRTAMIAEGTFTSLGTPQELADYLARPRA